MEISRVLIPLAEPILIVAVVLLLLDLFILSKGYANKKRTLFLVPLSCGLITAAYGILTLSFVTDAFWLSEVYSHSSSGLPLLYKLGNPWIGSNGSVLFITVLLSLLYCIYRLKGDAQQGEFRIVAYSILDGFLIIFILITLTASPFETLPSSPGEGMGLNPLLQTVWVLAHPPLIFLGYVSVFFAFALVLAGMITRTGESEKAKESSELPLYAAWLLLTLGIGLGGVWSYRVLGWGGYWAWDPVETVSLLPWLALTAYFSLSSAGRDRAREVMLMVMFFMVLFATALTRGGFAESLHAFGGSPAGFVFMGLACCSCLVFLWSSRSAKKPLSTLHDTTSLRALSRVVAFLSLTGLLAVCFIGTAAPAAAGVIAGGPVSVAPDFFNQACYPFTLAFVAAGIGCSTTLQPRSSAVLIAAAAAAGGVMAAVGFPTQNVPVNFGLPILVAAGSVAGWEGIWAIRARQGSARFRGRNLILLGIIVLLLGVFISSAAQVESPPLPAAPHKGIEVFGSRIELDDFTVATGTGSVFFPSHSRIAPEYSSLQTGVTVREGKKVHDGQLRMYGYLNYGIVSEPLIISTSGGDLYLSMHQTNSSQNSLVRALTGETVPPEDVMLVVKYVPLVWLVWLGILLMGIGMSALFLDELFRSRISA